MISNTEQTGPVLSEDPVQVGHVISPSELTDQFKLNHEKFASLGTAEDFASLHDHLIAINIEPLLNQLGGDDYFEVSVPVVGMTDFLTQDATWLDMPQQFATVIAVNGFGAHAKDPNHAEFPRPYFILAKDIAGNEYEIIVNYDGQIELPEQGIGLFSILTSLTFIYSASQILDGIGFADLKSDGASEGMLYLLPPPNSSIAFTPILAISHLDDFLQREIDVQHKAPLLFQGDMDSHYSVNVGIQPVEDTLGTLLHLEVLGKHPNAHLKPYTLHMDLESLPGVEYLSAQNHLPMDLKTSGWVQTAPTAFEKQIGLSDYGMFALVREVFSEFDFTKAMIQGESFGIQQSNDFNNFMLRLEAIGPYYDLLINSVIHQKIPGEFLLTHIPEDRWVDLDLSYADLDQHDTTVLNEMQEHFNAHDFTPLETLFLSENHDLIDDVYVYVNGTLETHPNTQLSIVASGEHDGMLIDHAHDLHIPDFDHLSTHEGLMTDGSGVKSFITISDETHHYLADYGHNPIELAANHIATTLHIDDLMDISTSGDMIKGFDVSHDKIDLSGLLDQFGADPDQVQITPLGEDIQIGITDAQSGETLPVATLVGSNTGSLPDDLGQIIITDS